MAARTQGSVRCRHGSTCVTRHGGRRCTCRAGYSYRLRIGGRAVERSGFATPGEAHRAMRDALRLAERGGRRLGDRERFDLYGDRWLEGCRAELAPGTWATYAPAHGAVSYFGAAHLGAITPDQVRGFRGRGGQDPLAQDDRQLARRPQDHARAGRARRPPSRQPGGRREAAAPRARRAPLAHGR
jgi:hypothetical protein